MQQRKKRFKPPTELEVAKYMTEKGVKPIVAVVEAAKFTGYWESMDWARKAGKMKSWKGSVATWIGNLNADKFTGKELLTRAAKADALRRINR